MKTLQEIVVTGAAAITAAGDWTLHGERRLTPGPPASLAINGFQLGDYLQSRKTYLDRCSALALAGCALALEDAGLAWPVDEPALAGIVLGTHLGCITTMQAFWDKAMERGVKVANPLLFSHSYYNSPVSLCAIEFGLRGFHNTVCAGRESGLEAVRVACDALRLGHATCMVAGGVEPASVLRGAGEARWAQGEAAAFFVLETAHRAHLRQAVALPITEQWLESPGRAGEVLIEFGDCGGATSSLGLMLQLAEGS